MPEVFQGLSNLASASAAVITIFTLVAVIVRGVTYIATIPGKIRAYFFRPKYILLPTAEEIAKYCAQAFDGRYPSPDETLEESRANYDRYYQDFQAVTLSRVRIALIVVSTIYGSFLLRLAYFGQDDPTGAGVNIVRFIMSVTAFLTAAAVVFALIALVIDRRRAQKLGAWLRQSF